MITNFLDLTPDCLATWMNTPTAQEYLIAAESTSIFKHAIYSYFYPDMEFRHKKTGFELVAANDAQARGQLGDNITENIKYYPARMYNEDIRRLKMHIVYGRHIDDEYVDYIISTGKTYQDVCIENALQVERDAHAFGFKPMLLFSGGADSEFMVRIFDSAGVDFECITVEYTEGSNQYELEYAHKYYNANPHIVKTIHQLSLTDLWQTTEFRDLSLRHKDPSPQLTTYGYVLDYVCTHLRMFPVSAGECRISKHQINIQ